jgi:predicted aspartyl protease
MIAASAGVCFPRAIDTAQVMEIPFTFEGNEIIVQVKINGKVYDMLLDTGTDAAAIELTTAKELGLKMSNASLTATGGGTDNPPVYLTILPQVELSALVAKNLSAAAIDLSRLSRRIGRPIYGVLGYSLLKDRIVQVDYPKQVIRFYTASPFPSRDKSNERSRVALPFRLVGRVPVIDDVYVNDKKVTAVIDTGSSQTFSLTPAAIQRLKLDEEVKSATPDSSVGYMGRATVKKGKIRNIRIGTISLDWPAVTFFMKGMGYDDRPFEVNIGNIFMKDFIITFDYRNKHMVIEKP